ncbi:unnamed protein product [Cuscuta epithymum]|uniref:Chromo domain-containing protein n=1 Tax=Cuscuta epithymum TaxID=186058 RepID=A0AAV0E1W6_9ASTE|nr:unnamed protein product [Cuscuta epithymum]
MTILCSNEAQGKSDWSLVFYQQFSTLCTNHMTILCSKEAKGKRSGQIRKIQIKSDKKHSDQTRKIQIKSYQIRKVHPVFHISLIKKSLTNNAQSELVKEVRRNQGGKWEVLVHWKHLPDFEDF